MRTLLRSCKVSPYLWGWSSHPLCHHQKVHRHTRICMSSVQLMLWLHRDWHPSNNEYHLCKVFDAENVELDTLRSYVIRHYHVEWENVFPRRDCTVWWFSRCPELSFVWHRQTISTSACHSRVSLRESSPLDRRTIPLAGRIQNSLVQCSARPLSSDGMTYETTGEE